MLALFSDAEVAGALTWEPVVSSWLGPQWLGDVPVAGGSVTWSTRREVPGSLELEVPRVTDGPTDWLPDGPAHPLAHFGQVLVVSLRVSTLVSGRSETIPYGRFLIQKWEDAGGSVRVSGVSLSQRIVDDRFVSPTPTRSGGTFASEVRRIVPASLGVAVDPGLEDRLVPAMSWDEDRMAATLELGKAWPARVREDMSGVVRYLPPLEATSPVLTLTDGVGGTVVDAYPSGTREGVHNVVVARGQDSDDSGVPAIQAIAEQTTGPYSVHTYGRVVRFFSSPLIGTTGAAANTATTLLADELRPASTLPVTMAPDPRVELDDLIEIRTDRGTVRRWGFVSGIQVPLTPDSDMRADVEVVATFAGTEEV